MNILYKILLGTLLLITNFSFSQITGNGSSTTQSTAYTDGSPQDVIYIYCVPPGAAATMGSLTASPAAGSGPGPYTFDWFQYNTGTNSFDPYSSVNNPTSSTINGLPSGGYSVSILNSLGNVVGCYRTWVFNNETILDAGTIATSCGGFNLNGTVSPVADFVYYNPPPDQFIIGPTTQITVCFDATHTYVSDLGFFLTSPNGTVVTLSPNPGSNGQGSTCNSGNNISGLCFTSNAAPNFDPCAAAVPYSGTYDSYGAGAGTPINWSVIYGQDASQGGWTVQIFDCIGADVGALTNASVTFIGNSVCGPETITYNSGNINSVINDNSCTAGSASSFVVPQNPILTTPITLANSITSFQWTDDNPCVTIPNPTTSLNPAIASTPTQNTWFYLTATDNFGCSFTDSVQFIRNCPCGTNSPFTLLTANIGAPDCVAGTFAITGTVDFNGIAPCTGTLTVTSCSGATQVFNAPFVGPLNYTLSGIAADGTPNCTVSAQFSNDPELCVITTNTFTEPICPCNIDVFNANISACAPVDNTYDVTGDITFSNPPGPGGVLTISVNNGTTSYDTIINAADYASPMNWSISGIDSDGANITISATFSLDGTCSIAMASTAPANCYCSAAIGTFVTSDDNPTNTDYVLCFGDQFNYQSNGDWTAPDDVGAGPPVIYNPGIGYLIYSCPPTPGMTPDSDPITGDPCVEGLVLTGNGSLLYNDLNDLGWINSFPAGTFTDNIIYYVPVTMYDITNNFYSVAIEPCYELGPAIAVQYLPEIKTIEVEDCQGGTITSTITGGLPEINGSSYNIVPGSLVPANASFVNTSAAFNGTIAIQGLTNGQAYSYDIADDNGCPVTVSGIFIGTEDPGFSYNNYTICTAGTDPAVTITGDPGTFSYIVVSGGPTLALNTNTGAVDVSASAEGVYDITYLTNDPTCFSDSTVQMTINFTPTVDPVVDQTVCHGAAFTDVLFTGTASPSVATTYDWTNSNIIIGLGASGTGDILGFTANNTTAAQITGLITVTPSTPTCIGTPTTYSYIVNPLDDPGFSYPLYSYCTSETDPTATINVAGGTFAYVVVTGGPTLVINNTTGLIDLSASSAGSYDITYTTSGVCPLDSTITMNIAATPTVNPVLDQTVCHNSNFADVIFTGSAGSVFDWTNDNITIGLGVSGNGDILAFTGTNTSGAQTGGLITVTPSAGSCVGTPTTFNLFVNPLDDPGFSYPLYSYCTSETDPTATINVAGGTFAYITVTGGPTLVINNTTGLIDLSASSAGSYDITYTTSGICPLDSTIIMNIAATPTVNPVLDQTVCHNSNFADVIFTGSAGSVFDWTNDNTTIGLGVSGNGDILAFAGTNTSGAQIGGLITVTPSAGSCIGTPTTFNLFVDPLDNPGFSYLQYAYCTTDVDPSATIDVAGGTFAFVATSGGPTLTLNNATGLIGLASSNEGIYDITYTTAGVCPQDSTISMTINFTPTVDPVVDQTLCHGANFADVLFTGTASPTVATTYDWTNDNITIGLGATGTGDILGFTANNTTTAQITGVITVTPSTPTCIGTPTTYNYIVDPLDDPGFSYPLYTFCTAEVDPTATIDAAGGVFSFTAIPLGANLVINTSSGLIDLSASDAGTYDITYTTVGICPQDSTIIMNIAATPSVDPVLDQTVCHNSNFADIIFTGSAGTVFDWTNDNTTIGLGVNGNGNILAFPGTNTSGAQISGLITVTPSAGSCVGTPTTFNLFVDPLDLPGFSYPQYNYCTADVDPTPTIDVAGGVFSSFTTAGGGSITLNTASGLIDLSTSNAGTFNITYTTVGVCPQDSTISMTIEETPYVNTIINDTVCENSSFIGVNFTGSLPIITYNWINDNALTGLATNGTGNISSFVGLTSGGQEISNIIVTPVSGSCTGPDSTFQLIVNPLDDPGFSYPQYSYCTDDTPNPSATVNVVGGTFTFVATAGGPNLILDPNTGLIDLVNSNEGVYDVTYTTSGVCPQDSTIAMVINFTPTVNAVLDQTVCHGIDFVDVIYGGTSGVLPTSFDWTNDNTTIGLSANGNGDILAFTSNNTTASQITGLITVTPSTTVCIGTPTTFNLNVDPLDDPSFQYDGGLTYCATGTNPIGNITGMTGGTFSYVTNSGGPTLSLNTSTGNVDLLLSNSGSYDITYTTNGVCPQTSTLTLVITNAPIANFSLGEYCALDTDPMPDYVNDDQGVPFPNIGSGGIFTEATGNLVINPATGEVDLDASVPGSYTVTNTINIAGCATANAFDDIIIHQMPSIDPINDTTLCSDAALPIININVNGEAPTWTIIYEFNGAVQPFLASQTLPLQIPNAAFGTYEIVSVSDQFCTSIISETVVVDFYPVVSMQGMTDYSACEGDPIAVADFSGTPNGNIYDWTLTSGTDIGFGINGVGNLGTFNGSNPQTVTVQVTPTSSATNGSCVGPPISFNITVNPLPVVQFTADIFSGCEPTTITFTDLSTNGSSYDWSFGDGNTGNGPTVSHTYNNAGIYDVSVTVTSVEGCVSSETEISYINITPMPVATFSFTPPQTDISHTEIEFTNSSIDADYYEWDFGDESAISNETDPIHVYGDVPDQYQIWLLATNNNGLCRDSIDAYLTIDDIVLYYVPNVFTPDFDAFNQTFKPIFTSGFDPQDYHLMIFNRWGELIFESYNSAIGWDGTYPVDGELCQDGVYVWKIEFKETMSDKRHNITGHVSLLK